MMRIKSAIVAITLCLFAVVSFANNADAATTNGAYPQMNNSKLLEYIKAEGQGKVVFVTIFASWCPPCGKEMPGLVNLAENGPENSMVIGISSDNDVTDLRRFLTRFSVSFPVFIGTEKFFIENRIAAIPQLMIFNQEGVLQEMIEGYVSEDTLKSLVKGYTGHDY